MNKNCAMCDGDAMALCSRCVENLRCLDLAQALDELQGETSEIYGFPLKISADAPRNTITFAPSREVLEQVLKSDAGPDLRRYFGTVKFTL